MNKVANQELREQIKEIRSNNQSIAAQLEPEAIDEILTLLHTHTEAAKVEEQNYGRIAALTDLLTWLKLHDIEDITMVQEYVNHVSASIKQFPNQPHVKHPDIRAVLKGKR